MIRYLLRRRPEQQGKACGEESRPGSALDTAIVLLAFIGLILTPVMVRAPFQLKAFKPIGFLNFLSFPCVAALLLSLVRVKKWTVADVVFFAVWTLLLIPMFVSNSGLEITRYIAVPFQNLLPVFFVFFRMNPKTRQKAVRLFMILFNSFIFILLAFAIEEKVTNKAVVRAFTDWLVSRNMYAQDFQRFVSETRFFSFWGHPLVNALLFNSFLALNAAWYHSRGKRLYALLYFPVAMAGVLFSGSKTGITVSLLLLIVIFWDHRKWLLLCIPAFTALYFTGAFNMIIDRFAHSTLTSGRVEALESYLTFYADAPLRWLSGYGSAAVYEASNPLYPVRAGFEFPLLMSAADYGIVFSVVLIAGSYGYITWRCLKKRQWTVWLCFTLVFADINTFNGYSLRNQDVFAFCYLTAMLMLNMLPENAPAKIQLPEPEAVQAAGRTEAG